MTFESPAEPNQAFENSLSSESYNASSAGSSMNGEAAMQEAKTRLISVYNPASGEKVRDLDAVQTSDVAQAAQRARAAQIRWEAIGFDARSHLLLRAQKWVIDHAERVIETIVSETGKTYEDAQFAELSYIASALGFWAKQAPKYLSEERVHSASVAVKGKKLITRYKPLGLIGVIGPWNYPLSNSFGDCIPALAAGNCVLLKPSEYTPLSSLLMVDCLRECGFPDDVFQVLVGKGEVGAAIIDHVDMVMFTGSTATGRKVMERAAQTITPVSLELGGKDPMIVLRDADLERAANAAVYYGFQNSGQTCISIERVYVEAPVCDAFINLVVEKVRSLRQGNPKAGAGTIDVGAITFPPQADTIERHIKDAVIKGAKLLTGGKRRDAQGLFFEPTVLTNVNHSMLCMTEETFGPTLPVMKVADGEEAIRLANDSPYGLAASIFTGDTVRGEQLARRLQAGTVSVNDAVVHYTALELPMGGWKASGLGSRHGADGIRKYTAKQSLLVSRFHLRRDLHMFPYTKATTDRFMKLFRFLYGRGSRV